MLPPVCLQLQLDPPFRRLEMDFLLDMLETDLRVDMAVSHLMASSHTEADLVQVEVVGG